MRNIGHTICALMKKNDIPEERLHQMFGWTHQDIELLKWGRVFASYDQLIALANLFGVSVMDILQGDNHFTDSQHKVLDLLDAYVDVMEAAKDDGASQISGAEYPLKEFYPQKKGDGHCCMADTFVVFCNGESDIVRCRRCGTEKAVPCNFDEEYS